MNSVVKIVILIWFLFLSAPTILSLVSDNDNTSVAYNIAEEETSNETKNKHLEETFNEFLISSNCYLLLQNKHNKKIDIEYKNKHDLVSEEIFSPPPEWV